MSKKSTRTTATIHALKHALDLKHTEAVRLLETLRADGHQVHITDGHPHVTDASGAEVPLGRFRRAVYAPAGDAAPLTVLPGVPGHGRTVPTVTVADALRAGDAYSLYLDARHAPTAKAEALAFAQTVLPPLPAGTPCVMAFPIRPIISESERAALAGRVIDVDPEDRDPYVVDGVELRWFDPVEDPAALTRGATLMLGEDGQDSFVWWPKQWPMPPIQQV